MPPSSDNICQQSSQFHFVNDFLYRPVNVEEAQTRPNVTLRYADRYYPENYYETGNAGDEETGENVRHFQQRPPPSQQSHVAPSRPRPVQASPSPQPFQPSLRPLAQLPQHYNRQPTSPPAGFNNQAFHSPEEVNIPLQSRRPIIAGGAPSRSPVPAQSFDFEN